MKGVLKIKQFKKYIPIVLTTLAFLFINIKNVSANAIIRPENILIEQNEDKVFKRFYMDSYIEDRDINDLSVEPSYIGISHNYTDLNNKLRLNFQTNNNVMLDEKLYHTTLTYNSLSYDIYKIEHLKILRIYFTNTISDEITINSVILLNDFIKIVENINNLNFDINNDQVIFNYNLPDDEDFSHLELHQDGLLLADNITTNSFEVYNLEYDTKYDFTFYAIDKYGNKSNGITREISLPSDPNLIPSNNIFGLNHSVSDTTVSFNYSLPLDNNFSHLKIYRNNELINDNYQLSEFIDTGLDPETEYNYRFVSVNKMDISNVGYAITIKTMEENDEIPPAVPTGLETTEMNSGIVLSWNTNNESDLQGYFVYMNGKKMNSKPITNTIYNITNLENGTEYNFTVSAVDTFDNESEQSISVLGVPDVDQLPIFKLDTQLSSIGSSVENWFSEIWLIVAFATAIPLSFAIAGRVKGLFIA